MSTRRELTGLSALLGIGAFVGMVALGAAASGDIGQALIASIAASATVLLVKERPVLAFGLLFVLASFSGIVVGLTVGRVRIEEPSIIAAVITLAVTGGWPRRALVRPVIPTALAFAAYLLVLSLSSALNAPEPIISARMITWTSLSMLGGVVAFALLASAGRWGAESWITATGVVHAAIGLGVAAAFLMLGPAGIPGMQVSRGEVPKVAGLAFEANLYASMLGATAPFALERFRTRRTVETALPFLVIMVGFGLGVTRGAYLGLAVGLTAYLGIIAYRIRLRRELGHLLAVVAIAFILAPSVSAISLPVERPTVERPTPGPGATVGPAGSTSATAQPVESREPEPTPVTDTVQYRANQIPVALKDLTISPVIGLGAASFGQRHELQGDLLGTRDYIGVLALVALYESGVVGTVALAMGFALALRLLLLLSGRAPGMAAAFVASLVSLLVAYQATNGLFFAINWLILGAGLGYAVRVGEPPGIASSVGSSPGDGGRTRTSPTEATPPR